MNSVLRDNISPDSLVGKVYWGIKTTIESTKTVKIADASVDLRTNTEKKYKRTRTAVSEGPVFESILSDVRPDDTVFDIGANTGLLSCLVADTLDENGVLIGFEPDPGNADECRINMEMNDPSGTWEVKELAVVNKEGTATLSRSSKERGVGDHSLNDDGDLQIKTIRIDGLDVTPNVMKIDIEGAELLALEGAEDVLRDVRTIYCEVHPKKICDFGSRPEAVSQYLRKHGFSVETIHEKGHEFYLKATKDCD